MICPQVMPLQLIPARLQRTTLLEVPLTTAVNCVWPPGCTCTVVGESETETDAEATAGKTKAMRIAHTNFNADFICSRPGLHRQSTRS